jgi:hypothetical protein
MLMWEGCWLLSMINCYLANAFFEQLKFADMLCYDS